MKRELMRTPEAAKYCSLSASTFEKLRMYEQGPRFRRVGPKIIVYDRADLDAWIDGRAPQDSHEHRISSDENHNR